MRRKFVLILINLLFYFAAAQDSIIFENDGEAMRYNDVKNRINGYPRRDATTFEIAEKEKVINNVDLATLNRPSKGWEEFILYEKDEITRYGNFLFKAEEEHISLNKWKPVVINSSTLIPESYGAIANDTISDNEALSNLILDFKNNSYCSFLSGEYKVTSSSTGIRQISNVNGLEIYGHRTTINVVSGTETCILRFYACKNIIINGFIFKGGVKEGKSITAIVLDSCENVIIENCDFSDCKRGVSTANRSNYITLERCRMIADTSISLKNISYLPSIMMNLNGTPSYGCKMLNCIIKGAYIPFLCQIGGEVKGVQVSNCLIDSTTNSAIYSTADGAILTGNIIRWAGKDGIKNTQTGNEKCIISNNIVYGAGCLDTTSGMGIGTDVPNSIISNNHIYLLDSGLCANNNSQIGIGVQSSTSIINSNFISFEGNIYPEKQIGILVQSRITGGSLGMSSNISISSNIIDSVNWGIEVHQKDTSNLSNVNICSNIISWSYRGLFISGVDTSFISSIQIYRNQIDYSYRGILVENIKGIIIKDVDFRHNNGIPIGFDNVHYSIIEGCNFKSDPYIITNDISNLTLQNNYKNYVLIE